MARKPKVAQGTDPESAGPQKGDFIAPPDSPDVDEQTDAQPQQEEFWRPPVRFGSVPVEKEPLGWDRRRGFRKLFPVVALPTQVVERVSFGHPQLEPNRLVWGDNLHVMRQLPNESIDLIYIDPPFFSGRQFNVIFGDKNELRSFADIWEGGMPGYLIWLNARLYEMKRLLKKQGACTSIWIGTLFTMSKPNWIRFLDTIVFETKLLGITRTNSEPVAKCSIGAMI